MSTVDLNDLAVWYGSMPESNGKTNWTAILYRKNPGGFLGGIGDGYTIARSEYPDRVRYEADRVRHLIGELKEPPFILDYDYDKHSGYKEPTYMRLKMDNYDDLKQKALAAARELAEEAAANGNGWDEWCLPQLLKIERALELAQNKCQEEQGGKP